MGARFHLGPLCSAHSMQPSGGFLPLPSAPFLPSLPLHIKGKERILQVGSVVRPQSAMKG